MKKSIFALAFMLLTMTAFAQNTDFFANTFAGIAGGANVYVGENDSYGSFTKRLAPALDVNVGKWLTGVFGLRLGYKGIEAKGWTKGRTLYAQRLVKDDYYTEKFGVAYAHGDFMADVTALIWGKNDGRQWSVIPYATIGLAQSYGNHSSRSSFAGGVGLLNNIRLTDSLDLTLDLQGLIVNEGFDGVTGGRSGEGMGSLTIGVAYNF